MLVQALFLPEEKKNWSLWRANSVPKEMFQCSHTSLHELQFIPSAVVADGIRTPSRNARHTQISNAASAFRANFERAVVSAARLRSGQGCRPIASTPGMQQDGARIDSDRPRLDPFCTDRCPKSLLGFSCASGEKAANSIFRLRAGMVQSLETEAEQARRPLREDRGIGPIFPNARRRECQLRAQNWQLAVPLSVRSKQRRTDRHLLTCLYVMVVSFI